MARILSRADVQRCLTMTEAIGAMREAFAALSTGQAQVPQRLAVDLPRQGVALLMPSLLQTQQQSAFALKLITVVPHNQFRQLPLTAASVLLLDADTGQTRAIMEGSWLTAMRTGAASGLATDLLALPHADTLALFGAGVQTLTQVLAIHTVRPLREVRVFNRSEAHFHHLMDELHRLLGEACPAIYQAQDAQDALSGAMLVACATTARQPLFNGDSIIPGTHVNAIGAFTPDMCEVDAKTLAKARIFIDQREAALAEAGDLLQPWRAGLLAGPDTWYELGDVVTGKQAGRHNTHDITVFKSVGVAVQDVAVALHVYEKACALDVGIEIDV